MTYSCEDTPLDEDVLCNSEELERDVGPSDERMEIVFLRDAYSLFASLTRSGMCHALNADRYVRLCKQYAEACLYPERVPERPGYRPVFVRNNQWF